VSGSEALVRRENRGPLQREDWVRAALRRLTSSGVAAVRVEVLARDLGATKGSFYWHFKDRADLLRAVLQWWQDEETDRIIAVTEEETAAHDRLGRFLRLITDMAEAAPVENAIFAWATQETWVAEWVAAVERRRIGYGARLLEDEGFSLEEAAWWSEMVYLTLLGMMNRAVREPGFRGRTQADQLERLLRAAAHAVGRDAGADADERVRPSASAERLAQGGGEKDPSGGRGDDG
jgi:AcrR family transcriptional regulator